MAKPASGTALNASGAFYSRLQNVWAILETSGTTLADSKGGITGTIAGGDSILTDGSGPYLNCVASVTGAALASTAALASSSNFTIVWGSQQANADNHADICGAGDTTDYLWADFSGNLYIAIGAGVGTWLSSTTPTIEHNYTLSCSYSGGSLTCTLYIDGVAFGTSQVLATSGFNVNYIGVGYNISNSDYWFIGLIRYLYLLTDTITPTEAATLAADPYGPLFTATPSGGPFPFFIRQGTMSSFNDLG